MLSCKVNTIFEIVRISSRINRTRLLFNRQLQTSHHLRSSFKRNHLQFTQVRWIDESSHSESRQNDTNSDPITSKLSNSNRHHWTRSIRAKRPVSVDQMSLEKPGAARSFLKNALKSLRTLREKEEACCDDLFPGTQFQKINNDLWSYRIVLFYPSEAVFEGVDRRKSEAEEKASKKALEWLQAKKILGYDYKPVAVLEKKKKQNQDNKRAIDSPLRVEAFGSVQQGMMRKFIEEYNLQHKAILDQSLDKSNHLLEEEQLAHPTKILFDFKDDQTIVNGFLKDPDARYYSIVSGRPVRPLNQFERKNINSYFRNFITEREEMLRKDKEFARLRDNIRKLPIYKHREQILDVLFENQVIVISGETGSGKTTQLPQFILEDMIQAEYGSECCVIVTQPRRLAAISVAEQTAAQFGEGSVGRTFGYHVRFDSVLPSRDYGCVLFCTTGILLRKMAMNPYLIGITHLIIDEVHEREFLADIIFVLLKKVLEKNKRIFIILMSASLNAEQFSRYFNNCPIIKVDGRLYPVKQYYLPEISTLVPSAKQLTTRPTNKVNAEVVADLINHINETKEGNDSILCFLPGWNDIKKVDQILQDNMKSQWRGSNKNRLYIVPVHSMLNSTQQKEIFKPLENGVRKVILSTNIAETSLTVPDVVYVIDPGLCNEIFYHKELNVSTFGTHWISQANAKQREGRAGRVKPGVCYKLYTKDAETTVMPPFPVPEILRIPLENVIMLSKLYCHNEKIVNFLERTMQSPLTEAIEAAVQTLKCINVLDANENLTHLGRKIIDFTTHPRLSVCLVNASMLGCIDRMLNLVVMLSNTRDPFDVPPDNRNSIVRQIKTQLSDRHLNDYLALIEILENVKENTEEEKIDDSTKYFIDAPNKGLVRYTNFLNRSSLESALNLKKQYTNNLRDNGLLESEFTNNKMSSEEYNKSKALLSLALVSGLYPNILKFGTNKKIDQNLILVDVNTGQPARYTAESVLHHAELRDEIGLNSCSIYFNSFFSEDMKKLMIKDAACVPPLFILLVIGKQVHIHSQDDQNFVVSLDGSRLLTFSVNKRDLELILQWKEMFYKYQEWYLISEKNEMDAVYKYIRRTYLEFIQLTYTLFERYSNKYTNLVK